MDEQAAKRVAVESARAMFMRPSERQAVSALERVINQSKTEGFYAALVQVETQILSVSDLDELLTWIRTVLDLRATASTPAAGPPSTE